jgi:hypothetical protein
MPEPKVGANRGNAGKGRPKGAPNKTTAAVKDMILQALNNKGGVDYLERQAEANPTAFLTLVGKVIPLQLTGDPNAPIVTEVTLRGVRAN